MIPELGVVEPRFSRRRVVFVAGKFPLVIRAYLIPGFPKREMAETPDAVAIRISLRPIGKLVGMVVRGASSNNRCQNPRSLGNASKAGGSLWLRRWGACATFPPPA
jgi:hypothetical protein